MINIIKNLSVKKTIVTLSVLSLLTVSNLLAQREGSSRASPLEKELLGPALREGNLISPDEPLQFTEEELDLSKQEPSGEELICEEPVDPASEEGGIGSMINEWVEFGGAIEIEYFWIKDFENFTHSDISLETAELDFEISFNDCSVGVLGIEYEPDEDHITLKEAFVTFANPDCTPYFIQTGRLFVPFGIGTGAVVGDTLSVSDPLTIEIFETREDVLMLGYERNGWYSGVYIFNGDSNKGGDDDHLDNWGATIRYGYERRGFAYSLGLDFISNVFDSDGLQEAFEEEHEDECCSPTFAALEDDYAPGFAVHARYFRNGFSFVAEYNGAFETNGFEFEGEDLNLAPKAWMVELGYQTTICCHDTFFAFNYSRSYDLYGTFPKTRILATVGRWLYEDSILLACEYGHDEDYSTSNGGTGKKLDSLICQLTYEW